MEHDNQSHSTSSLLQAPWKQDTQNVQLGDLASKLHLLNEDTKAGVEGGGWRWDKLNRLTSPGDGSAQLTGVSCPLDAQQVWAECPSCPSPMHHSPGLTRPVHQYQAPGSSPSFLGVGSWIVILSQAACPQGGGGWCFLSTRSH